MIIHGKKYAFTLAEVLITLGIIGVVAALTIPTLIKTYQEMQYKTAYRNAYSDLYNAFNKAKYDGEFLPISDGQSAVRNNFDALKANFKSIQSCENSLTEGCWVDSCMNNSDCSPASLPSENIEGKSYGFIDSSGRFWNHYKKTGEDYFWIIFDTNGASKPNSYGRDRWFFKISDINNISNTSAGTPYKIETRSDIIAPTTSGCIQGNCYYRSWLTEN